MSQEQLAEIINVSRQAITKWESDLGLPATENLKSLSNVFNISIDYLLDNIVVSKSIKSGIIFGSALAMVISYANWHSAG